MFEALMATVSVLSSVQLFCYSFVNVSFPSNPELMVAPHHLSIIIHHNLVQCALNNRFMLFFSILKEKTMLLTHITEKIF